MPYKENMPGEMLRFAQKLLSQTKVGQVGHLRRFTVFLFPSTRSSMIVAKESRLNEPSYSLQLLNAEGAVVTSLKTGNIMDREQNKVVPGPQNKVLEELYYEARGSALDIKNTLEDMFNALGMDPEA